MSIIIPKTIIIYYGVILMNKNFFLEVNKKADYFIERYENNIYISNFIDVIVSIGFPIALTGSIFYIAANPPRGTDYWLFKLWLSSAAQMKGALMVPYFFTWGIISVVISFSLSYKLSFKSIFDPILASVISTLSFLAFSFAGGPSGSFSPEVIYKITGPNGVLTAFIISIACFRLLTFIYNKNLYFNVKFGVSPLLSRSMKNLFPAMIIIPLMWLLGLIIGGLSGGSFQIGITAAIEYIVSLNSSLPKDMAGACASSLLYFTGMDGSMIKQPVYNVFMNQGGFGTFLPLSVLFILSYSKHLKQIGKLVLVPCIFNISFPIMFAAPIIMNPIYLIPFVLYPLIGTIINYLIISTGILSVTVEATYTMPVLLSGYFSTTGEIIGVMLQVLNFVLSLLIYYPFFLYHESRLVKLYGIEKEVNYPGSGYSARIQIHCAAAFKKIKEFSVVKKGSSLQK